MYITSKGGLLAFGSTLGQNEGQEDIWIPPSSYQAVFDHLNAVCVSMIPQDECRKLLGHRPFVCPIPTDRPITADWRFYMGVGLGLGLGLGVVLSRARR